MKTKRDALGLAEDHMGLLLWDVWNTHLDRGIIDLCKKNFVTIVYVPAGLTGDLQLMDVACNAVFKQAYRKEYRTYLEAQLYNATANGESAAEAHISVGKKDIKEDLPIWLKNAWSSVDVKVIQNGWKKIGTLKCWDREFQAQANSRKFIIYPQLKPNVPVLVDDIIEIPDDVQDIPDEELSYIEVQNGGTAHLPFVVDDDNEDSADPGWWEVSEKEFNIVKSVHAIQPKITGCYNLRDQSKKRKRND